MVSLEVQYRTRGSFLVSYSLNLSKGGLFLETTNLLPVGSQLSVRFTIPGTELAVETEARVMWIRPSVSEEGLPPGLGLQFTGLEDRLGAIIDRMVQDFQGMRLVVVAGDTAAQERLSRNLRSILTADVVQCSAAAIVIEGFGPKTDLVLMDLDSAGSDGLTVIEKARGADPPIPILAVTRAHDLRTAATVAGAESVLENPPPYELLRQVVLDTLGKPYRAS